MECTKNIQKYNKSNELIYKIKNLSFSIDPYIIKEKIVKKGGSMSEGKEDTTLKELADLAIANLENQKQEELFDAYIHRLTAHFYTDEYRFHERFINGYEALLQSLKMIQKNT